MNENVYFDGNKIGYMVRVYRHLQQYIDYHT